MRVQSIKRRILGLVDSGLSEINRVERESHSQLGGPLGLLHVVFGFLLLNVCLYLGDVSLPLAADFLRPRRSFIFGGASLLTELVGSFGRLGSRAGEVGVELVPGLFTCGFDLVVGGFRVVSDLLELCA